jgi:hypothetical protein
LAEWSDLKVKLKRVVVQSLDFTIQRLGNWKVLNVFRERTSSKFTHSCCKLDRFIVVN